MTGIIQTAPAPGDGEETRHEGGLRDEKNSISSRTPPMTNQSPLSLEERADLKAKAEKAREGLGDGAWSRTTPATWINAPSLLPGDTTAHIADVRGWGYLTGGHHALALDEDTAFRIQKQWGDHIAAASPSIILRLLAALEAKDEAIRAELIWLEQVKNTSGCRYTRIGAESRIEALQRALSPSNSEADNHGQ